jgi:hypothetical protein
MFIRLTTFNVIDVQITDDLDMLLAADSQQSQRHEEEDAFDTYVNAPKIDISVAPFNGQALTWWAHQPSMRGLRQMAIDVLGTPGKPFERLNV